MRLHCTNEFSNSPEEIFPWIADPEKAMQWQGHVKGGKIITSTPDVVGTTFSEVLQEGGTKLEMAGVVTQFSPNELIAFHLTTRIHEFDVSYALEGTATGTRLSIDARIRWKFPMNFINIFMGKRVERQLAEQLRSETEQLKRICEGDPHG